MNSGKMAIVRGEVSNTWRYQLASVPAGTSVTESYEVFVMPRWVRILRRIPGMVDRSRRDARRGMQVTLDKIKATAERS